MVEPAADKQMKYVKKLYKKVYGEAKGFDDKGYLQRSHISLWMW
jgi:hypothetical protein